MFAHVIAPILGTFFISLSLINLSSNINPSLHLFMVLILKIFYMFFSKYKFLLE
jgi:hypothetical protein